MKFLFLAATLASFLHSFIAFYNGDFGYALGLFGGSCAWLMVIFSCDWNSHNIRTQRLP